MNWKHESTVPQNELYLSKCTFSLPITVIMICQFTRFEVFSTFSDLIGVFQHGSLYISAVGDNSPAATGLRDVMPVSIRRSVITADGVTYCIIISRPFPWLSPPPLTASHLSHGPLCFFLRTQLHVNAFPLHFCYRFCCLGKKKLCISLWTFNITSIYDIIPSR